MSDSTIPLLTAYARALVHQKVPEAEQQLALLFAEEYLNQVAKENGRLSAGELEAATLAALNRKLSKHIWILKIMLVDPEQGFGTINQEMRPVLLKKPV